MILSEFMSECSVASVVDGQEEHFPAAGIHFTGDSWKLLVITGKYWRSLKITGWLLKTRGVHCCRRFILCSCDILGSVTHGGGDVILEYISMQ